MSQKPDCFGKEWDPEEPECAGGLDPNYEGPNGTHVRTRCNLFSSCSSHTQANKYGARARAATAHREEDQLLPLRNLLRRKLEEPRSGSLTSLHGRYRPTSTSTAKSLEKQIEEALRKDPSLLSAVLGTQVQQPILKPTRYQAVDHEMPSYLTVEEEREEDDNLWGRLGRELARSALKGGGHTLASFFDHNPFRVKKT